MTGGEKVMAEKAYRRIATEEGFNFPEIMSEAVKVAAQQPPLIKSLNPFGGSGGLWDALGAKLGEIGEARIAQMDADGIDMQLLLLSSPGVQTLEETLATELAAMANDRLSAACRKHPTRFAGLAAIAPQNPDKAAQELQRAVRTLGLKGAVVNSHTHGEYLDAPKFRPILECAAALDVPIYIHPRDPSPQLGGPLGIPGYLIGWGWALETGTHAIRLMASSVFDELPKLKFVIGHMGEGIPFMLPRLDNRYTRDRGPKRKLKPSEYFKEHFVVTTSGMNYKSQLMMAVEELGIDRVLFAADWPFEPAGEAVQGVEASPLSTSEKAKIFQQNAARVFSLIA
jgi:2,3-dihydroxybenzoate decarboxylase